MLAGLTFSRGTALEEEEEEGRGRRRRGGEGDIRTYAHTVHRALGDFT